MIDGKVAVVGDLASVKAAIDTKGNGGFANEPGPKAALDSSTDDHVGFVYVALRPLLDWSTTWPSRWRSAGRRRRRRGRQRHAARRRSRTGRAYWLRFESDAIVMEATQPEPETRLGPTENRRSTIAEHVPATALVAGDVATTSATTLKQTLDLYRADPTLKPVIDQLDQALGLVGGADAAFGWVGDSAVVVNAAGRDARGRRRSSSRPTRPRPTAAVHRRSDVHRRSAAASRASRSRDETYDGTTITIVDLGDLSKLARLAGAPARPARRPAALPTGHVEIAYAVTDEVVVIGSGPGFVKHVLDTTSATSLASNDRYKSLADRAGKGTGSTCVDIAAIRGLDREGRRRLRRRPGRDRQVPDRHQAVPRPVRRDLSRRARPGTT